MAAYYLHEVALGHPIAALTFTPAPVKALARSHHLEVMVKLKSVVRVYNGLGTNSECVEWTIKAFSSLLPNPSLISTISAKSIQGTKWMVTTQILIIPGGAASPYHNELGDLGMANIKEFVHSGKTLIGLCAGAYFTAAQSNFAVGTAFEVINQHLGLFPGIAQGPFFEDFDYLDRSIHYIHAQCFDSKPRMSYVHGGGWFVDPEKHPNITVLARYKYQTCGRAAMIKITDCGEGKGVVLASHLHFEHPGSWTHWRDFIFNALEHEKCLVYSGGQTK